MRLAAILKQSHFVLNAILSNTRTTAIKAIVSIVIVRYMRMTVITWPTGVICIVIPVGMINFIVVIVVTNGTSAIKFIYSGFADCMAPNGFAPIAGNITPYALIATFVVKTSISP